MKIEDAIKSIHSLGLTTKTVINIMFTSRTVEERIQAVLKEHELSLPQYNVLRILRGQRGNPANLSTVQERMIDKSSNTTRLVDKLIKKNWVKRKVCENNRRKIELFITAEGLQLLTTLDPLMEANNENIVHTLTETELTTLNYLLDKLRS